jgi:hypothetical protein
LGFRFAFDFFALFAFLDMVGICDWAGGSGHWPPDPDATTTSPKTIRDFSPRITRMTRITEIRTKICIAGDGPVFGCLSVKSASSAVGNLFVVRLF